LPKDGEPNLGGSRWQDILEAGQQQHAKIKTFGGCECVMAGYDTLDFDQAFLGCLPDCPLWFG
jgi:hypothetical protein